MKFPWSRRRDRQRRIFSYRAGRTTVEADPIVVSLALHRHSLYLPRHLDEALAGDSESLQVTVQAARDVFRVASWQDDRQRGMTVTELLELMVAFDGYSDAMRDRYESLADSTALYGGDMPSLCRSDYEAFFGLWLNRHREHIRQADVPRLGISGALGERRLGWFAATAESEDEAVMMYERHRAEMTQEQLA